MLPTELPTGTLRIEGDGQAIDFAFPDGGNARSIISQVFSGAEYPIFQVPSYTPSMIVDIGANVGAATIFFSFLFPDCPIRCFEPSPASFAYLQKNISTRPNIQAYNVGLWHCEMQSKLYTGRHRLSTSSIVPGLETTEHFEMIELRRASTEFDRLSIGSPSILKLDTEGCELQILTDLKDRLSGLDFLYLEYHSEEDRRAIENLLGDRFVLGSARARIPHRGTNAYISRSIIQRAPNLAASRIDAGA